MGRKATTKEPPAKKRKQAERMERAMDRLAEISERIAPFVQPPRSRFYTTEGQWRSTSDRFLE